MTVKSRRNEPNIYFIYDIAGRLVEVNDLRPVTEGGGITSYKYDRLGRVTEVNDIDSHVIKYVYNERGLRAELTYPGGAESTYEYDGLLRLKTVKHGRGSLATMADYQYDQLGRRTLATLGNDSNAVYDYDIADRLLYLTNNVGDGNTAFDYNDYDKVGNRKSCKMNGGAGDAYTYDELYQLTKVDYNDGRVISYSYDALGNRKDVNENGDVTSYTSNSLNQYASVGDVNYTYDKNGNLTCDGFYKYYYDCENRLTDVNYVNNSRVASYKYDWSGRRVRKIDYTLNPVRYTLYCYDDDQVITEYDENGTMQRKFVYGAGIDEPVAMYAVGSGWYYYHYDGLGSVAALSDSSGNIVEQCSYDVFGEPNCISGVGNPYKFTGREYDAETGLYYYRARYYSPELGRFLERDPVGYLSDLNLYRYVKNNPLKWVDPLGLDIWIETDPKISYGFHQRICIGNPAGDYDSFSFGVAGSHWNILNPLRLGEIYEDYWGYVADHRGTINRWMFTSGQQDDLARQTLRGMEGTRLRYGLTYGNCRTIVNDLYDEFEDQFDAPSFKNCDPPVGDFPSLPGDSGDTRLS
jgi:RHS repeat-associated protein